MRAFLNFVFDSLVPIFVNNSDFFIFLLVFIVFLLFANAFRIFRG